MPPLYPDVITACLAAGWQPVTYEGFSITRAKTRIRYVGVVAVHGDLRAHVEWQAGPDAGQWRTRFAELAVRHPGHDPGDYARVYPAAWRQQPGRRGHRCRLAGTHSLLRLLTLPPAVITSAVLDRATATS